MDLVQTLFIVQSADYVLMAATAIVAYDQVLNFSQEVDLIWNRRWSLTTALYLVARYSGSLMILGEAAAAVRLTWTYTVAAAFYIALNWSTNIFLTSMQAILLMRAYALCGGSTIIFYVMVPCFCCQAIAVVVMTGMAYTIPTMRKYFVFLGAPIGSVTQDAVLDAAAFRPLAVIIPALELVFDVMIFVLALFAFLKHATEARELSGRWSVNPLMKLLVTDQMLYFLCYLALQAISFVISDPDINPTEYADVVVNTTDDVLLGLAAILGPRMVLSLRAQEAKSGEDTFDAELTTIQFGARDLPLRSIGEGEPAPEATRRHSRDQTASAGLEV
ncbi:hypothetical protein BV22DRAFT_798954 [Leucogyrophana mollusca]|uniref:Uncharacterized protein n=1 Tax=Leucogyrophana mollusca TaxID=85980 RepID=A0ACB8B531_9AGAM|nr:hypothetical protein BV22DRAFT_798954 [Leucogyrophana mollusca]